VTSHEGEAERRAKQVRVEIVEADRGYEVRTRDQGEVQVDLDVRVPKKASLTARTSHGGLEIKGVAGNVAAESQGEVAEIRDTGGDVSLRITQGDTHVANAGGNVKVSGSGGDVEIADVKGEAVLSGEFYGPIRFERAAKGVHFVSKRSDLTVSQLSGRIEIGTGRTEISDAPGNVNLITSKKDISLENVWGKIHIENRDGNIELRFPQPPRESIEVINASGNIEIVMPPKSGFQLSAESRSGEINCEWAEIADKKVEDNNVAKLDAKVGAKGPMIRLRTSYGTINIRKGE
jgi:DUF4097 and DUF4098 domain-containing protein YvlB